MSISREQRSEVTAEYRRSETDSGSPELQVAVLTHRINALTEHLRGHDKDHAGRRGLLMMVSKRRKHLNYLLQTRPEVYHDMVRRLGLRK